MEIEDIKALGITDEEVVKKLVDKFGEEVAGLKQNQASLLAEKKELAAKMKAFDGVDAEEYRKLKKIAEELENKHLKESGEFEKLKEKLEKQWQENIASKDKTISRLLDMVKSDRKQAAINEVVRKYDGVAALTRVLSASVQAVDKDGEVVLQILADDGSPLLGDDGRPATLDSYVAKLKADPEYAGLFKASGMSGGGASNSGGKAGVKTITRDVFDKMSQVERVKFFQDGGKVVE